MAFFASMDLVDRVNTSYRSTVGFMTPRQIAGVAHGLQHPSVGALPSEMFSRGEATVRTKLESLGFDVVIGRLAQGTPSPGGEVVKTDGHRCD
jgi:hypothetical protein